MKRKYGDCVRLIYSSGPTCTVMVLRPYVHDDGAIPPDPNLYLGMIIEGGLTFLGAYREVGYIGPVRGEDARDREWLP